MDSLSGIVAFVRAAQTLSFVEAGRSLGISASAVGKSVAKVEQSLGVRLFHRSTRRVNLTPEGAVFYERCRHILDDLQDARDELSHSAQTPRGELRVSLPTTGYRFLLPYLPNFSARYPDINLDLDFTDHIVNVIEDGFDVVIRSGELPDSRLMSRRLGPFRFVLCASPAYLVQNGVPKVPDDLKSHRCIRFKIPATGKLHEWLLTKEAVDLELSLQTSLICNNMEAVQAAAISGFGIAYVPDFLVQESLKHGSLQTVLDDYLVKPGQFWALWPSSRHLSPKLRVFVDFLSESLFASTTLGRQKS